MVKSKTFRSLGYFYAITKIVLSLLDVVKCAVNIGGIHDSKEIVKLMFAFLYIGYSVLLILGILLLIEQLILANRKFMVIMNVLMIVSTTGEYLMELLVRRQLEKGITALIIVVVILIAVLIFELWLINGVLRYVRKKKMEDRIFPYIVRMRQSIKLKSSMDDSNSSSDHS